MTQPSFICNGCQKQFNGVPLIYSETPSAETVPMGSFDFCSVHCAKQWLETLPSDMTAKGLVEVAPARPETGQHG